MADKQIEVDPAIYVDSSEDYASSGYNTSTTSLTSSINEYIFENGRRYHAYFGVDKNLLPVDEKEQDRLDMHHELLLKVFNGEIHLAPIGTNPQRIIDIGTGTGIWAIDAADKYPSAEVIGTDLSPIQPNWVPPNCKFECDDAELPWTYRSDSFDFVHIRNLAQGISKWPQVLAEVHRTIKPGGFVELSEGGGLAQCDDGTLKDDNPYKVACELLNLKALPLVGRETPNGEKMKETLEKAGFVDVTLVKTKVPIGPWAKDRNWKNIGAIALLNLETAIEAYALAAFTRILQMDVEEATDICKGAWKAVNNKNTHMYMYHFIVYGRKPENDE